MMGVPGLHVGLRGAGATPCTELSVHAPGGDRRQGRRCSETHCLRAENGKSALKSQKQKHIVYSLKPKILYTVWKQKG